MEGTVPPAGKIGLTAEDKSRINPFDWNSKSTGFGEIMNPSASPLEKGEHPPISPLAKGGIKGGFDVVIGNPPYVRIQAMKEWAPVEVEFYKHHYVSASKGNYDIYVVFVEKGLSLLNPKGRLGFILPHKFFQSQYGEPLRKLLSEEKHLAEVIDFGEQQIFEGATTYTCLLFLNKTQSKQCVYSKVADVSAWRNTGKAAKGIIPAADIKASKWNFNVGSSTGLLKRLRGMPVQLGDMAHIFVGTQTSADDIFVLDQCRLAGDYIIGISKSLGKEVKIETACTRPFLRGKQIRRYELPHTSSFLICPYEITSTESRLLTAAEMTTKFPLAFDYLKANKPSLSGREKGKFKGHNWYAFGYPKSMALFQKPKIIVPDYNNVASFSFDHDAHFYKTGYGILLKDASLSAYYVLALLNSPLLFKYLQSIGTSLRGGYIRFWTQFIGQLPIRTIDFDNSSEKAIHDKLVSLVDRMLELHKKKAALPPSAEREKIEREITITDEKINDIVYGLYGVTEEEERKIIEG